MNDGIAMLLDRMKTNPEEFFGERDGKWENLVYQFQQYLDPSDVGVFKAEVGKLMRQRFTEKVMEELIDPEKLTIEDVIKQHRSAGTITLTTGGASGTTFTTLCGGKSPTNIIATPIAGVTQTI
jgi:hypothetical protein